MAGDYPFPDCNKCSWRDIPYKVAPQVIIEGTDNGYVIELRDEYGAIRHRRVSPRVDLSEVIMGWLDFGAYDYPKE